MKHYFIGGLGGNCYHLAPLIDELGFPVTFLDPYREMIQTEKDPAFEGRARRYIILHETASLFDIGRSRISRIR